MALGAGDAGAEGEVGDARGKGFEAVEFHQVEIVGHAVDQMQRVIAALLGDLLQHRGERRQPGATGQQQQRPTDVAQVEAAQGTGQAHAVAGLGHAGEEAAHQATRHVADQETDLTVALQRAERIGTGLLAAGNPQVHVLPRQERQFAQGFALDRQRDSAVGQLAHGTDGRVVTSLTGAANLGGRRHPHHAIALRTHLAGQDKTLLGLFRAEGVFDVLLAQIVGAGFGKTLAGTASTVAAVQRDVDALAVRGIGHGFADVGVDEPGDAVFKIERNGMGHDGSLTSGRHR
ncbi:hypothetical protein D9M69_506090 [compost metagenome]